MINHLRGADELAARSENWPIWTMKSDFLSSEKKSFIRNEFHEASIECRNYANMLHSFVQSERWEIWTNNPTKSIALLT